jgi:hypothetical protein
MEQVFEKKLMEAAQVIEAQVIKIFKRKIKCSFDCYFQLG